MQHVHNLYTKNYVIQMKEIKPIKWRDSMFMDWKNPQSKDVNLPQNDIEAMPIKTPVRLLFVCAYIYTYIYT